MALLNSYQRPRIAAFDGIATPGIVKVIPHDFQPSGGPCFTR
jgi:hypothetical protein